LFQESTRNSASCDIFIDSLARSIGELAKFVSTKSLCHWNGSDCNYKWGSSQPTGLDPLSVKRPWPSKLVQKGLKVIFCFWNRV